MELALLTRLCDLLGHLDLDGSGERESLSPCPIFPLSPKHTSLPYGIITLDESVRQENLSPGHRRVRLLLSLSLWDKFEVLPSLYKRILTLGSRLADFKFESADTKGLYTAWLQTCEGRIEQTIRGSSISLTSRYTLKIRY